MMSESANQLCGTVRGRRLTDSELVKAVHRVMDEEPKMVCFSHTSTDAVNNKQQIVPGSV
jgi:hypothetical protein